MLRGRAFGEWLVDNVMGWILHSEILVALDMHTSCEALFLEYVSKSAIIP